MIEYITNNKNIGRDIRCATGYGHHDRIIYDNVNYDIWNITTRANVCSAVSQVISDNVWRVIIYD